MLVQSIPSFAFGRIRESRRTGGASFQPADTAQATRQSGGLGSTASLSSLGTLLAIQQVELQPQDRRRRAVRRGEKLLDALQDVQLDLLSTGDPDAALERLRRILGDQADADDPELGRIVAEIETRAAVELAKRERDRNLGR